MKNEFIEKLQKNEICSEIMKSVDNNDNNEKINIEFNKDEIMAIYNTCYEVYNSFCNDSDEDDGLSINMNRYLDDLNRAIKKLTW